MEHVKHPTLAPELLHGQTILERKPTSQGPRQRGRLFVSDKKADGSFILRLRPEPELRSEVGRPTTEAQAEPGESVSPEGRLLFQSEVDRIRANSDGERQLTGCAFTLDVVRGWVTIPANVGKGSGSERSSFRGRPPRR